MVRKGFQGRIFLRDCCRFSPGTAYIVARQLLDSCQECQTDRGPTGPDKIRQRLTVVPTGLTVEAQWRRRYLIYFCLALPSSKPRIYLLAALTAAPDASDCVRCVRCVRCVTARWLRWLRWVRWVRQIASAHVTSSQHSSTYMMRRECPESHKKRLHFTLSYTSIQVV